MTTPNKDPKDPSNVSGMCDARGEIEVLSGLVRSLTVPGPVVEIGCFAGRSSLALALPCQATNRKFIGIDPWVDMPGIHSEGMDSVHDEFLANMENAGLVLGQDFEVYRERSEDALQHFQEQSLAMVFVDGDHEYEGAKKDLIGYPPMIKPGGILVCHDCGQGRWPGVEVAWREVLADNSRLCHATYVLSLAWAYVEEE